MRYRVR